MKKNSKTGLYESQYWHPAVTTDAVVFGFDDTNLNVLLIKRDNDPYRDTWALPGGFIREEDETAKEGVFRELHEETNVKDIYLEELKTFSNKNRDDDAKEAKWFPIEDLPALAFDHAEIIQTAINRLRERIHFTPIGFDLLDDLFTMQQLQAIYIAILNPPKDDKKLRDRRNFPRKMLKLGYIKETEQKVTGTPYKQPKLYTFDKEAYDNAKKIGMRLEF